MFTHTACFMKSLGASRWWVGGAICGLFLFHSSLLWGQDVTQLIHFSTSDGLPGNNIAFVKTDAEGFVWAVTSGGLARYDGRHFVPFSSLRPGTSLPQEGLLSLQIDRHGFLWMSTEKGLYSIALGTFEVSFFEKKWTPYGVDRQGNMWFGTPTGLAQFKVQNNDFQEFTLKEKSEINGICQGRGPLLLVKNKDLLFSFDTQKQVFEQLPASSDLINPALVMASDSAGLLWLSRWYNKENGLVYYDPYEDRILRSFGADARGMGSTDCNDICVDGDQVWLATNTSGLCRYSMREDRFYCYPADDGNERGIGGNQLGRLSKDAFGNLWIASPIALYKAPIHPQATTLLSRDAYNPNSLIARPATVVHLLSDTLLAIGTLNGISLYNRHKKSFFNFHLPPYNHNQYNNQVNAIYKGEQGSFWVGSWSALSRVDERTGRVIEYYITHGNAGENHPKHLIKFPIGAVRRLYRDRAEVLWVVAFGNHVSRISGKPSARQIEYLQTLAPDDNLLNDRVESFLDLDDRFLLLGTLDGLVRYDRLQQIFQPLPAAFPGLQSPVKVSSLARSRNGDVLLIANGEPFRVQLGDHGATVRKINSQLDMTRCQQVIEDEDGAVWITLESGVAQVEEAKGLARFYDARHFLHDNVLAVRPHVIPAKDRSGNLYFGGAKGVTILNLADFALQQSPDPMVKITAMSVNGEPFVADSSISRMHDVALSWEQNNLGFECSVLNAAVPELSRFAYSLNGGNVISLGTQNRINFSNLAPGTYWLHIKAANSDGAWGETGVRLRIRIRPPWWQTTAAYCVYALMLGAGAFFWYRFQLRQKLAEQEARQLREIDAFKSRFFTNITHEFRTPLTVILGMSEQMEQGLPSPEQSQRATGSILRRNAQSLFRLINQLLDLAKLESNVLQLNYLHDDVLAYLRYIAESLHSYAYIRQVRLRVESPESEVMMDYDPERLLQIVHNLLSNAIKFTPAAGQVTLRAALAERSKTGGNWLCISVTDTGAGIPADDLPRVFDRFYQAKNQEHNKAGGVGIGLALTQELVKLMGGSIAVESVVGQGSTFTVWLPITHQYSKSGVEDATSRSLEEGQPWHVESPLLPASGERPLPTPATAGLPTVLLIEDNPDVVEYLRLCLTGSYQVELAYNGQAGVERALEIVPDLIVSDVMMPEKDGFEVCDFLKNDERTSHIPIILLTARATVEDRIAGLRRGADAYMAKPFHREEFLVTVANLLESRKKLQARLRNTLTTGIEIPADPGDAPATPEVLSVLDMEDAFVQKMRRYVEEHISHAELSMDELSRAMTMSYQNLHRKLTALTNLSPVQFIRFIRLQKAKMLLQTTQLPIGDIAFEVGFSDPKYFSRVFTEEFGKPPSLMRMELQ